jgi:hypothetical protein
VIESCGAAHEAATDQRPNSPCRVSQRRNKINKTLTAIVAATLSLSSIHAFAGNVGNADTALQSANTVNVTGASNSNNGGARKDRETLAIAVVDSNGPVADAKCVLTNSKGDWSLTAPDSVEVRRSDSDLQIKCEKAGYDPVTTTIKASKTEIPRPQFHFAAGGSDDDDQDAMITVPQYAPSITVTFGSKQANAN